ncbi:hypothetical protein L3Q82_026677 [Scortum barcoo]|uniref:Uncharacterized protein n=1 Tax=Scortum barcoo TaxID=214431 RepID=A0ACB8WJ74_9TELE|nr:hypothetical protein L3Q82_026677 [Scortum barcoo]
MARGEGAEPYAASLISVKPLNTEIKTAKPRDLRRPLSVWSKLCYAIGGAPYQITGSALGFFLQIYLLDVAQLDPSHASIILFVGRAWDAVTDPTVGFLVSRSRWTGIGRMMPWILFSTPFAVLTYFLIWYVPPFGQGNVIWYLVFYCLFQSMQTCFHVPYSALTMFISSDQKERDSATAYRMMVEVLGTVLGTAIQGQIVGGGSHCPTKPDELSSYNSTNINKSRVTLDETKQAYLTASGVICVIYVFCAAVLFLGVKEQKESGQKKSQPLTFRQGLWLVMNHGPYIKLVIGFLFTSLAFMLLEGNFALFITHALGHRNDYQNILLVIMLSGTLTIPWWQWFLTRFGKKTAAYFGILWAVPFMILIVSIKSHLVISYLVSVAAGVSVAAAFLLPWSMLPDVVDDFKVNNPDIHGHEALFYSFYVFFIKFASGVSLGVSTLSLKFAGYETGSCSQPEMVSLTLKVLVSPVPVVLIVVGLLILKTYPIDEERRQGNRKILQNMLKPSPRSPARPEGPRTKIRSDLAYLPDVSVTCSTSDFVVRVKPAFYGQGADAEELTLGDGCKSNGLLRPYGDLLFTYPLTACGAVRQSPPGYLVYKFVLRYEPSPKRFPSRAQRIDVDIECRYQRYHHVHQLTVQPTWATAVLRKSLKGGLSDFQIEVMDDTSKPSDSWSKAAKSKVYQLGKSVHFQVSAPHPATKGKLYINSCYATPSSESKTPLKYTIIDNFGCMLDSKRDPGASQFVSRTDKTLRFSLKAFQFTSDPETEVSIHCNLSVTSEDPGPAHKSCTYRGNRWEALTGDDSICDCCDSQCVTSKSRRAMMEGMWCLFALPAVSESLLVSDQPYMAEDGFLPVNMSKEGKVTVSHYTDELLSHENLWETVDVVTYGGEDKERVYRAEEEAEQEQLEEDEEGGVILGVTTEPDLGFRVLMKEKEFEVEDSNQLEDGSGYTVQEGFSDWEEEGFEGEDENSDLEQAGHMSQEAGKVLRHWVQLERILPSEVDTQRELQPLVTGSEEENGKQTVKGEEDDRTIAPEVEWKNDDDLAVDNREKTWYFTWR